MWKALDIAYVVVAAMVFISLMVIMFHGWRKDDYEEIRKMEYPEDAGFGILTIAVLFLTSIIMAVLWPLCPVILAGILIYDKIEEKWPKLCRTKEEEDERGADH